MRSGFFQTPVWISTEEMAETIGIHPKTLLGLRRKDICPFEEGTHYRRKGVTANASAATPLSDNDRRMERCIDKDLLSAECLALMADARCSRHFQHCCYSLEQ